MFPCSKLSWSPKFRSYHKSAKQQDDGVHAQPPTQIPKRKTAKEFVEEADKCFAKGDFYGTVTACLRAIATEKEGSKIALSKTSKWMRGKLVEYMEALRSVKGVITDETKESGGKKVMSHYCWSNKGVSQFCFSLRITWVYYWIERFRRVFLLFLFSHRCGSEKWSLEDYQSKADRFWVTKSAQVFLIWDRRWR